MRRYTSLLLLCAVFLTALAGCSKPPEQEELEFLPVLEEPTPEPPLIMQELDFEVSDECELVKLFDYASFEEYSAHNVDSVFKAYAEASSTPYDGKVYVTFVGDLVTALYSTSGELSLEVANNMLGVGITQGDINDIQTAGAGFGYASPTGDVTVEYTGAGWCVMRSLLNPNASEEGVS